MDALIAPCASDNTLDTIFTPDNKHNTYKKKPEIAAHVSTFLNGGHKDVIGFPSFPMQCHQNDHCSFLNPPMVHILSITLLALFN